LRTRFSIVAIVRPPPGQGRVLPDLDPASPDEGVQVAGGDTDVAAELHVGDAALEHQPAHEPRARAQSLGGLLDR
jgi:hypothetical protein